MNRTLAIAVTSFSIISASASAQMAVFDVPREEYSAQIRLIQEVQGIDYERQVVTVQYPGGDAYERSYERMPCRQKPYVQLVILEPGMGWRVFTPISSCFEPLQLEQGDR